MTGESWDRGRQYLVFAVLSVAMVGLIGILGAFDPALFQPFFGRADPLLVAIAAMVTGGLSVALLQSRGWFEVIRGKGSLRGVGVSAGLATALAVAAVIADALIRYPEDMNVLPPQALLFYPAIGYVVEVVFHLLPLAFLLLGVFPLMRELGRARAMGLSIFMTALLEPGFQLAWMDEPLSWPGAHTFIQVFAVNLGQLCVFKRYDFVSMYAFRLSYYALWHIGWGVLRLSLLF